MVEENLGATGGRKLRSIMFIIIESGMALFSMQLVRLVLYIMSAESDVMEGYAITLGIDQMLHVINKDLSIVIFSYANTLILQGITPTIILVRVSMGLSFHDEESMVEATTSLRFNVSNNSTSTESIGHEDDGLDHEDDDIGI